MDEKRVIRTEEAPAPFAGAPYSQAIVAGGLVFTAGQVGLRPGDTAAEGDVAQQTEQALANVAAILEAAGSRLDRVCSMTIYITDRELWPRVNETYARILGEHRPARAVIPVPELRPGCLIEIQAIAAA